MRLGESIRHGAKWLLASNLAGQVLQFAFGIILARLLVPADFGLLITVQIFTGLAGFIAAGGTGQAIVRAKEAKPEDFQVVFTIQLVIGLLIYTVFFVAAPLFAHWYRQPLYTELFRVSAISFIFRPFSNMPGLWLMREMRFKERTLIHLIFTTLGSLLSVLLAWRGFGVWSLVFGGLVGSLLAVIVLLGITPIRPALRFNGKLARELGLYGVKVMSNNVVSYIRSQTPNFFLGQLRGPAIVGLFNKADSLAKTPRIVAHSVYDPVFRSLASVQDNLDRSQYIYFRTITLLTAYMAPLFIGLAWLAHPLIAFVYGPKWVASAAPLPILALVGPLTCVGYPAGAVLAARNWLGRELYVQAVGALLFAASSILGIRWGLQGVAWGILMSEVLSVVFMAYLASRCLRSSFRQLAAAILPGAVLNSLLVAALLASDLVLPEGFREAQPAFYITVMTTAGALSYGLAFLFLPIPALAGESAKWRTKLRLNQPRTKST